ncbi:MAG TPA: selenoneine biosynthesis selenosugar synthase SenB [Candidatus Aquilonibacter sp.]|nr:selenoneine biosynthesis selenosugar synthase SenB [Candidatus Aquilonibacter sp.]
MSQPSAHRVAIVSPSAPTRRTGNVHTARRYAGFLRDAGYRVRLLATWQGEAADVLVALHARKSADSILAFARAHPGRPIVVVLTGTDVYRDLARSKRALRALEVATAIVTLQPDALAFIPKRLRNKATPIEQSAVSPWQWKPPGRAQFCVLGHLRYEKDPLRAGLALAKIPRALGVRVVQAGAALDERFLTRANRLSERDARYRYLGEVTQRRAMRMLAASSALVLSSRMEGGANVLSEAIAAGTPVIASRISGNSGILGSDYPAYFPPGDTAACAALMRRCAQDARFLRSLHSRVRRLAPLVRPQRERDLLLTVVKRVLGAVTRPRPLRSRSDR